jgi:hypothetical protein
VDLLWGFQVVGLRAYPLEDLIGAVVRMVQFLAWSFLSDVHPQQADCITYCKLVRFCMPMGVYLLCSNYLLPALLNSSPEYI